jgi:hypothetical protein
MCMESSLIKFIKHYRDKKMSFVKLKEAWEKKVSKKDFDDNETEVFLWFQNYRKEIMKRLGTW